MNRSRTTKSIIIVALCIATAALQAFTPKQGQHEQPTNLKILPKDIAHDELIKIMQGYSMALGVHCNYCHAEAAGGEVMNGHPRMDFASDEKQKKVIARGMMEMVSTINKDYITKMDNGKLDQVSCVTCHNGHTTPMASLESLKKDH